MFDRYLLASIILLSNYEAINTLPNLWFWIVVILFVVYIIRGENGTKKSN